MLRAMNKEAQESEEMSNEGSCEKGGFFHGDSTAEEPFISGLNSGKRESNV